MDQFAQTTGKNVTLDKCLAGFTFNGSPEPVPAGASSNFAVMDYYDGNTVTGIWNYAQHWKRNFVDNTLIDQSSVVQFIEHNWGIPAMGNGAADATAGSILSMFNFSGERNSPLFLNPLTGEARGGR